MSSSKQAGGWTFSKSGDNQSLLTAFRADDSLVQMIPQFEWPHKIQLQSSSSSSSSSSRRSAGGQFGPFLPNIPTVVPLWLALHLQTKSMCRIIPPHWLTTDNLRQILAFEKTNAQLWPPQPSPNGNGNDVNDEAQQQQQHYEQQKLLLPRNYYELATRLAVTCEDCGAVKLLVTDLLQVRLDKLRQQFQSLLSEQSSLSSNTAAGRLGLIVGIAGIGTAEVACLRETVQQTLNDKEFLQKKTESSSSSKSSSTTSGSNNNNNNNQSASKKSFMPPRGGGIVDDDEDDVVHDYGVSPSTAAAASTTTTPGIVQGGRRPVRRFRGSIGGRNNNNSSNNKTITPGTT